MPTPPKPEYDYDIERLVNEYKRSMRRILRELESLDLIDLSYANAQAALANVAEILKELDKESAAWINEMIHVAVKDGVAAAIFSLGVVETMEEAKTIAKFNKMNREMIKAVVADTQADLLQVTQNVSRKTRVAVRKVVADSMRANMTAGINGRRTITRDVLTGLRKELGAAVETGIIDKAGRRWAPDFYVDTVVRTKMMESHIEATRNEGVGRGVMYAVVSRNGSKHAECAAWEGRVLKLSADAPGDYPTLDEARSGRSLFHPRCKHVISLIRNPEEA